MKQTSHKHRARPQCDADPQRILSPINDWFQHQGWSPLPFQKRTWEAHLQGLSGLIQVPTGSGKTYAAVMGPIAQMLAKSEFAVSTSSAMKSVTDMICQLSVISTCYPLYAKKPRDVATVCRTMLVEGILDFPRRLRNLF